MPKTKALLALLLMLLLAVLIAIGMNVSGGGCVDRYPKNRYVHLFNLLRHLLGAEWCALD